MSQEIEFSTFFCRTNCRKQADLTRVRTSERASELANASYVYVQCPEGLSGLRARERKEKKKTLASLAARCLAFHSSSLTDAAASLYVDLKHQGRSSSVWKNS